MADADNGVDKAWNGAGTTTKTVGSTGNQDIDGVLAGIQWNTTNLSFSFTTSGSQYGTYSTGETSTFQPINSTMQTAALYALKQYASASNLAFTQIAGGNEGSATIRFGMSNSAQPTAYAYYPSSAVQGGDVWFGTQTGISAMTNPQRGNYAWHATMHELGHALGLKHGQETSGPGNTAMTNAHDDMEYTVMTYRSYVGASDTGGYTNEQWGYAQSLMMYDIAAIQDMYGANFSAGAHTYKWDANTGQEFIDGVGQGAPGANRVFMTVWDGGGSSTYDFSSYNTNGVIDLTPDGFSNVSSVQLAYLGNNHYAQGNVYNALQYQGDTRSLIRNVIVGNGNDTITGNAANNIITIGTGNDTINGGAGRDTVVVNTASTSANLVHNADGSWTLSYGTSTDTLTNVEMVQFTDKTVSISSPQSDFNGSGTSDILLQNGTGGLVDWFVQNGVYNGGQNITGSIPVGYSIVGTGDFNGDGTSDVLLSNGSALVDWTLKNGVFNGGSVITANVPTGYTVVGTGDFNNDGTTDLVLSNGTALVEWSLQNGQFAGGNVITGNIPTGYSVVGTGDFNGDGTSDLLLSNGTGLVDWTLQNGQFAGGNTITGNLGGYNVVGTGDFNGDGTTDILLSNGTALVEWSIENGIFAGGNVITGNIPAGYSVVGTGDYNNDGTADVLLSNGSYLVDWSLQNGRFAGGTLISTSALNGFTINPSTGSRPSLNHDGGEIPGTGGAGALPGGDTASNGGPGTLPGGDFVKTDGFGALPSGDIVQTGGINASPLPVSTSLSGSPTAGVPLTTSGMPGLSLDTPDFFPLPADMIGTNTGTGAGTGTWSGSWSPSSSAPTFGFAQTDASLALAAPALSLDPTAWVGVGTSSPLHAAA